MVLGYEVVCYLSTLGIVGYFVWRSTRSRAVDPGIWITIAVLSIFWLEGPFDWAMYAQFDPGFTRFPDWGPLGVTWGGLPTVAPVGYVFYFAVPSLIAVWIARRLIERSPRRNVVRTLLVTGFVVGCSWDIQAEAIGTRLGLWRYGRVAPGLVLFGGTKNQVPLYVSIGMGALIMTCTYLFGRQLLLRRPLVEGWVEKRARSRRSAVLMTIAAYALIVHAIYVAAFVPHLVTKVAGWDTVVSRQLLFSGVENQPR